MMCVFKDLELIAEEIVGELNKKKQKLDLGL